jgi:probable HAF family extracellular repeat protein
MYRKFLLSTALTSSLLGLASPILADVAYTVTDLGPIGRGDSYSEAHSVNASGQSVGYAVFAYGDLVAPDEQYHAFSALNGVLTDLGTLGGSTSEADAVNSNGQIVGNAFLPNDQAFHAFITQNSQLVDLGTLGGTNSEAHAINTFGQVVGSSSLTGDQVEHAFIDTNGVMTDLGTLGGSTSEATGINDSGQVVGNSWTTGDESQRAFISQNGIMTDLGSLGGDWSEAHGINARGDVVGLSYTSTQKQHAYFYHDGWMQDLGTLGGNGWSSHADAINSYQQIVGSSWTWIDQNNEREHAFVTQFGTMVDLNGLIDSSSGWTLAEATGINDSGQIVGAGYNATGQYHGYMATPVPTAPPSVSIQPGALNSTVTGAQVITATATSTISGGQAPFQYKWTVSGGGGVFSISSPFDISTDISASVVAGEWVNGSATLTVTDVRGRTSQASVPIKFTALLPPPPPNTGGGRPKPVNAF